MVMKDENWIKFGTELKKIHIHGQSNENKWENPSGDIRKTVEVCFPEKVCKREYKFVMSTGLLKSPDKKTYY